MHVEHLPRQLRLVNRILQRVARQLVERVVRRQDVGRDGRAEVVARALQLAWLRLYI